MRLGVNLRLLIPTLGILLCWNANHVYAAQCEGKDLYTPFPFDGDDAKYRVCFSNTGDSKEYDCPDDLNFNEELRSCAAVFIPMPKCTFEGERFKNPFVDDDDCISYIECVKDLHMTEYSCDAGKHFNPLYQDCVLEAEYDCDIDIPDCSDPDFQNRKWIDKESCDSYYECVGDILVSRTCPSGMYLDVHTQACMYNSAVNGGCQVPKPQPNYLVNVETMCQGNVGKFLPDPHYCKAYYYCVDESTPYWSPCSDGRYFENETCTKTRASSCICEDLTWGDSSPKSVNVPHPDKTKFYVCRERRQPEEKSCPPGTTFNATKKMCAA